MGLKVARQRVWALAVDLVLVAFATCSAFVVRDDMHVMTTRLPSMLPFLLASILIAVLVLPIAGLNRTVWRFSNMSDLIRILGASSAIVLGAVISVFIVNRLDGIARSLPLIQFLMLVAMLSAARVAVRLRHSARIARATLSDAPAVEHATDAHNSILIVGINPLTELYLQSAEKFAPTRQRTAGLLGRADRYTGRLVGGVPVLGTPEQVADVVRNLEVHGVTIQRLVVTCAKDEFSVEALEALLEIERESDIRLEFVAERLGFDESVARSTGYSQAATQSDPASAYIDRYREAIGARPVYRAAKRMIDVIGSACLLLAMLPLCAVLMALVAVDVGTPTLFWQQRPGRSARPFRLYKFRSMRAAHDGDGRVLPDELRATVVGRALRRTRLDELPQLYNILIGDMSFVGPRPLLPRDQPRGDSPRLLVRPGLTGWAQVSGGREVSVSEKTALDLWYLQNASLRLDFAILFKTIMIVLRGERRDSRAIRQAQSAQPMRQSNAWG